MNILWVSADKRAAMRTTSYPVYRTPILINLVLLHRTVNIILIITNSKDDAIENFFFFLGTQKSRCKTSRSFNIISISYFVFFFSLIYSQSLFYNIKLRQARHIFLRTIINARTFTLTVLLLLRLCHLCEQNSWKYEFIYEFF